MFTQFNDVLIRREASGYISTKAPSKAFTLLGTEVKFISKARRLEFVGWLNLKY